MQRAGMKSSSQTKKPPDTIGVHDVIQHKDESVVKKCRVLLGSLLQNSLYRFLMTSVTISDCVIVAIQINPTLSKSGWNVLDLLVTLIVILEPMLFLNDKVILAKVIRVLRVFRSIVGILAIRRFATIVKVITDSVPQMGPIFLFFVTILLLFSVCGVNQFSTSQHFSDLGTALYTLFICLTQDGWVVIFWEFRQSEDEMEYYEGIFYFIMFISVGGFIFANLFATITSNLASNDVAEDCPTELEEILNEGEGILGEETMSADQDDRPEPCILSMINDTLWVLDKNLSEYDQLHQELKSILKEVHSLPVNQEHEQEELIRRSCTMAKLNSDLAMGRSGDILSTLITQEKAHIFDSKSDMPTLLKMGTRQMPRPVFKEEEHSEHK
ncbi:unnamed protein product [Lota lota]